MNCKTFPNYCAFINALIWQATGRAVTAIYPASSVRCRPWRLVASRPLFTVLLRRLKEQSQRESENLPEFFRRPAIR